MNAREQATSTAAHVSIDEYLHTSYRPDADYVSGELQERNWGEYDHGAVQAALIRWFGAHRNDWNIRVIPELRFQTRVDHFRIPDVMILDRDAPKEQIITRAPLLCIEILSPEDRFGRMSARIAEYLALGALAVWVIDPQKATGWTCTSGALSGWTAQKVLTVPGTPITLTLDELFADLD